MGFSDTYDTGKYQLAPKGAVVLDLSRYIKTYHGPRQYPGWLRALAEDDRLCGEYTSRGELIRWIADQIEEQTKPPRIPEPGLWGVVEASLAVGPRKRFVHVERKAGTPGYWSGMTAPWLDDNGIAHHWRDLVAPTLVREGI